jgi:hypothetical protein
VEKSDDEISVKDDAENDHGSTKNDDTENHQDGTENENSSTNELKQEIAPNVLPVSSFSSITFGEVRQHPDRFVLLLLNCDFYLGYRRSDGLRSVSPLHKSSGDHPQRTESSR